MRKLAIVVVIIAVIFRFYNLTLPPLFFDESIHATILKSLFSGNYRYDPAYHGPLLYYTLYIPVKVLGESELSLRLFPAVVGVFASLTPLLYRRYIGFEAASISAILLAVSPVIVNYSRFCREDITQLFLTALFVYFIFRYLEEVKEEHIEKDKEDGEDKRSSPFKLKIDLKLRRRSAYLILGFAILALFATLKETFYPIAAIFLLYFIFDIKKFRMADIALSILIFILIYTAFYTNFFTYTTPLTKFSEFPAVKAVSYWKYQHDIARIAGPWYYYLELILLYDLPVFVMALFAISRILKDRKDFEAFTAYWFLSNLIFFSYMQEKVPWLAMHILFPMYILAGIGISKIGGVSRISSVKTKGRWVMAVCAAICIAFSAYGSVHVNHLDPVNPAEPALYLPTQYDVRQFAEETENETVYVFTNIGEYWPLAWYLKDHKAYFITTGVKGVFHTGDYIVVNETSERFLNKHNLEFKETLVVRCWTFWTTPDLWKIPEFIVFRKPLTDVSCMNFSVYVSG